MPAVAVAHDKKYGKAIGLPFEMGGAFRTMPARQLRIGRFQLQALRLAGPVPNANGSR
jgi:hypothetical protein